MSIRDILITAALMCLWGFNFSAIKLGADQTDPILLTALRFSFAVVPVIFFIRRPQVPLKYLFAYGIVFGTGVWGMMIWAINLGISAGMAGLLMNMSLLSSIALGYWLFQERLNLYRQLGAVLAIAGLMVSMQLQDGSVNWLALPLTLIAALSWSLTGVIVKKSGTKQVFAFSVWGMAFAPLPLCALALVFHGSEVFTALPAQLNGEVWFSILFQAYPTTLLGYWIWNRLTMKYPLSTMAPFTLLIPVFGLIGSSIFFGEEVSAHKLSAFVLILAGLGISLWSPRAKALELQKPSN